MRQRRFEHVQLGRPVRAAVHARAERDPADEPAGRPKWQASTAMPAWSMSMNASSGSSDTRIHTREPVERCAAAIEQIVPARGDRAVDEAAMEAVAAHDRERAVASRREPQRGPATAPTWPMRLNSSRSVCVEQVHRYSSDRDSARAASAAVWSVRLLAGGVEPSGRPGTGLGWRSAPGPGAVRVTPPPPPGPPVYLGAVDGQELIEIEEPNHRGHSPTRARASAHVAELAAVLLHQREQGPDAPL